MKPIVIAAAIAAMIMPLVAEAQSDEARCQKDLSNAAGVYLGCVQKAIGKYNGSGGSSDYAKDFGSCVNRYSANWPKLVKKFADKGTSCEGGRYTDNGDGTFYDRLTRLTWEKKTEDGSVHDWRKTYSWSTGEPWKENGTAFTEFLKTLNDSGFGGSSGWRLPSIDEMNSLVEPGYPKCTPFGACTTAPGPLSINLYWSSSSMNNNPPGGDATPRPAWVVDFLNGGVSFTGKMDENSAVRAVRSGS